MSFSFLLVADEVTLVDFWTTAKKASAISTTGTREMNPRVLTSSEVFSCRKGSRVTQASADVTGLTPTRRRIIPGCWFGLEVF